MDKDISVTLKVWRQRGPKEKDNIVQSINKVQVKLNVDITMDDLWGKLPFNDFYEELKSTLNPGEE